MTNKKIIVVILSTLLLTSAFAMELFSQPVGRKGKGMKNQERMNYQQRDSLRCLMQSQVLPEMLEIKNDFDTKLSKNELDKLNEMRDRAAALKNAGKAQFNSKRANRGNRGSMTPEQREALRAERDIHREKMQSIIDELQAFKATNKTVVDNLTARLETFANENEGLNIFGSRRSERRSAMSANRQNKNADMERRQMRIHSDATDRFLLWNGQANFFENNDNTSLMNQLGNSPNPFTDNTVITITMPKQEQASVELYDNSGNHLGQIFNGTLQEGENTIDFSASSIKNLTPGVLIYKVKSNSVNLSGKMIYRK